jgi:hypothetical protein
VWPRTFPVPQLPDYLLPYFIHFFRVPVVALLAQVDFTEHVHERFSVLSETTDAALFLRPIGSLRTSSFTTIAIFTI